MKDDDSPCIYALNLFLNRESLLNRESFFESYILLNGQSLFES